MLRALQWDRGFSVDKLWGLLRRLLRPAALMALMFLVMRAELLMRAAPMAAALMAAGLAAGESAGALAAGCLLGMFRWPLEEISLLPALSCAGVMGLELCYPLLKPLRRCATETRASLAAGACALLPPLIKANGAYLPSAQALACGLLAAASAPFLFCALRLRPGRQHLMLQEKTGLWLLLACGLAGLHQTLPPMAQGLAALTALLLPGGAALAGLSLAAGGASLLITASLCIAVLAASLRFCSLRWQRALLFSLAAGLCQLLAGPEALDVRWAICAAMAYSLLPETWLRTYLSPPEQVAPDADCLARQLSAESSRRMRALGDAFAEMAERGMQPSAVPDEQELICEMRSRLCSGCSNYGDCWAGADNRAVRLLCSLIADALDRVDAPPGQRVLYSDGEIPPDLLRLCRRGRMIPDRLGLLLRDFAERRRSEIKRCATDQLLSVQLMQAREILYDLAEKQGVSGGFDSFRLEQLRSSLEAEGFGSCGVFACGREIRLSRPDCPWNPAEARRAAHALNRAFGGRFAPELRGETLLFTQQPRYQAESGACCQSGIAGQPCGDSHRIEHMNSRIYLLLSDGMGSGESAAQESQQAVDLLWRFLEAGISRPLALETLNQQLLMRNPEDMFATVDLCCIDLDSGIAEFSKMAACRTLILRGGEIMPVEGGQLPLGILEGVRPGMQRIRLRPGDLLVMGSDGVMEAGEPLLVERIVRSNASLPPDQLAETLVREAALRRANARRDDLTCICLKLRDGRETLGFAQTHQRDAVPLDSLQGEMISP